LSVGWKFEKGSEHAVGDDPSGQGIAKLCHGDQHLRREVEQAQDLAHPCTGNAKRSREIRARRTLSSVQ
jgi:hypothetical protein